MQESATDLPDLEDLADHAPSGHRDNDHGVTLCNKVLQAGPGLGSVWLKTFGCAHNVSDGEYMAGLLVSYGYR